MVFHWTSSRLKSDPLELMQFILEEENPYHKLAREKRRFLWAKILKIIFAELILFMEQLKWQFEFLLLIFKYNLSFCSLRSNCLISQEVCEQKMIFSYITFVMLYLLPLNESFYLLYKFLKYQLIPPGINNEIWRLDTCKEFFLWKIHALGLRKTT